MSMTESSKTEVRPDMLVSGFKLGDPVWKPPKPRPEAEIIGGWQGDIDAPLVSIVCHSYNHELFIDNALDSFLMQETTFPFEIIVHDDASLDGTQAIIKRYQKLYPNIIKPILQAQNIYSKAERPTMYTFSRARGKYIAFCEGDDFWSDQKKIEQQACFLEKNPDYVICYTGSIGFRDNRVIDGFSHGARKDLSALELRKAVSISTLTACFRNVLDSPPELALITYGDKFIWSRLGKHGKGKFMGNIQPSFYRIHPGGVHSSATLAERQMNSMQSDIAMAAYYKRLGDEGLSQFFFGQIRNQVYKADGVSSRLVSVLAPFSRALRRFKRLVT
jgi:glycosyltransferase involved in cell wall biosynthesis